MHQLRINTDNYEAAAKKELGPDYPTVPEGTSRVPLVLWYANNPGDIVDFEAQVRRKPQRVASRSGPASPARW